MPLDVWAVCVCVVHKCQTVVSRHQSARREDDDDVWRSEIIKNRSELWAHTEYDEEGTWDLRIAVCVCVCVCCGCRRQCRRQTAKKASVAANLPQEDKKMGSRWGGGGEMAEMVRKVKIMTAKIKQKKTPSTLIFERRTFWFLRNRGCWVLSVNWLDFIKRKSIEKEINKKTSHKKQIKNWKTNREKEQRKGNEMEPLFLLLLLSFIPCWTSRKQLCFLCGQAERERQRGQLISLPPPPPALLTENEEKQSGLISKEGESQTNK